MSLVNVIVTLKVLLYSLTRRNAKCNVNPGLSHFMGASTMIKKLFCISIKLLGLSENLFWFLLKLNPAALHTWLEIRWFLTRTCSVTCEKILMPWIDQEAFDISANKHIKELNRRRRRTLWTNLIRCVILIFDGLLKNFNFFAIWYRLYK